MQTVSYKDLSEYSNFGLPGGAARFLRITDTDEMPQAARLINRQDLPVFPVGAGTNTITPGYVAEKCVLHLDTSGWQKQETANKVELKIAAGENWDDIVQMASDNGWAGITALSAIPGSVGAAPVQNIGAYGQELSDVIDQVTAYDLEADTTRHLPPAECNFGYRTSRFKQKSGRFIVLSITISLQKRPPKIPDYGSVAAELQTRGIESPTHRQLRDVIVDIRWSKLPRPKDKPNVGSFFTNPIVSKSRFEAIKNSHKDVPGYKQEGGVKIPAGWLIEETGLKGARRGSVGISDKHALVIISDERAEFADLAELIGTIRHQVRDEFGIELQREPRVLY